MRHLDEIIVHCAATRPRWMADNTTAEKVAEIRDWHVVDNGWSDIGYHYLIDRDGTIAEGRPLSRQGAHVGGHNTDTVGICLLGGHGSNENDTFEEHFTPAQEAALVGLLKDLLRKFPAIHKISGHNQYSPKACPGFRVPQWWSQHAGTPDKTSSALAQFAEEMAQAPVMRITPERPSPIEQATNEATDSQKEAFFRADKRGRPRGGGADR